MNSTEHDSEGAKDFEEGDGFLLQSIIFSFLAIAIVVSILFCNKNRVSSCFEKYLVVNLSSSDEEYAQRVITQQMEMEKNRMESPEKRTARLRKNFEKNSVIMVLEMNGFLDNKRHDVGGDAQVTPSLSSIDDTIENGTFVPPHAFELEDEHILIQLPKISSNGSRQVPNCCAVCLCSYDVGDTIVWSSNKACQHAFHDTCIIQWLVKHQKGTPCPCCRSEFTDLEHDCDAGGPDTRRQNRFIAFNPFRRNRETEYRS